MTGESHPIKIRCAGCGKLIHRGARQSRCSSCLAEYDKAHNWQRRGLYDTNHKRVRAGMKEAVATGQMQCGRCKNPVTPLDKWTLDHYYYGTSDEFVYVISHEFCNARSTRPRKTPDV